MTRDLEQPQVARLERGDVNPTFETLLRLAGGHSRSCCGREAVAQKVFGPIAEDVEGFVTASLRASGSSSTR